MSNPNLTVALAFASKGLPTFPVYGIDEKNICLCRKGSECRSAGKHPLTQTGFKEATTEQLVIRKWWSDNPSANIGMPTGKVSGVIVLDVDGQEGVEALKEYENAGFILPLTKIAITGRDNGKHLYFQYDSRVSQNNIKVIKGCDVRSDGGYVIVPPSKHRSGRFYKWEDEEAPIAKMPEWLIDAFTKKSSKNQSNQQVKVVKQKNLLIIEGERNDFLFRTAIRLVKNNADFKTLAENIRDLNERKCQPPLDEDEIEPLLESAWKYKLEGEADGEAYDPEDDSIMEPRVFGSIDECMRFFDAYYYKAIVGGKVVVLNHGRPISENLSKNDFYDAHANKVISNVNLGKELSGATYWFKHTDKMYARVIFNPDPDYTPRKDELNLWGGFTIEPDDNGKAELFLSFIKEVVCLNNQGHYDYLMDWMARITQKPHDKTGANISVALRGSQGVGKSFFVEQFGHLFGDSFVIVNNTESLTGRFNTFLLNKVVVLGDEAIWGGDKGNRDILKNLISSSSMNVEAKFKDAFTAKNYCRFFFTTNSDWASPAERGNRRYLVLDVSDAHKQDKPYFDGIVKDLKDGGYADLLYTLLMRDWSGRDFEQSLPKTYGTQQNILNGLNTVEQWLFENLGGDSDTLARHEGGEVRMKSVYGEYLEWAKTVGHHPFSLNRFSVLVGDAFPSVTLCRKQIEKERGTLVTFSAFDRMVADFESYLGIPRSDW